MFSRGCGTRSRVDFIFLIREKIAHAKVAKAARGIGSMGEQSWIFNACLRSFPFRKELGRPRMVVPTGAVV